MSLKWCWILPPGARLFDSTPSVANVIDIGCYDAYSLGVDDIIVEVREPQTIDQASGIRRLIKTHLTLSRPSTPSPRDTGIRTDDSCRLYVPLSVVYHYMILLHRSIVLEE